MELNVTSFTIFVSYTILITLVLMNLVIAILSDKYESVTAERLFYEGKTMLRRSLVYEKILMLFQRCCSKKREQTYHYLFVSRPQVIEEDVGERDGMIGTVLQTARIN